MKKIIVTGATGFLGKNICLRYLSKDFMVIPFNRISQATQIVQENPDYVIHCAGEIYDKRFMFKTNVELTYRYMECARHCDNLKRFVYIGSSSEYGLVEKKVEHGLITPHNHYAGTKAAATMIGLGFHGEYGMPFSVIRPFSVYGPYDREHKFIPTLFRHFKNKEEIELHPGIHDWIYIDDFLNILDIVINEESLNGKIINAGTGVETTNEQVYSIMEDLHGYSIPVKRVAEPRTIHDNNINSWKCVDQNILGFYNGPLVPLDMGLRLLKYHGTD